MSRVTLATPTLRRYDLLEKMLASAEAGTLRPDTYAVVDNGGGLVTSGAHLPPNTVVHSFNRNVGVAASWNFLIRTYGSDDDLVIVSNDDVAFHASAIEALMRAAENHPDVDFFSPSHARGAMFCVFLVRRRVLDKIGPFDEGFWPAYFEDNDFHRRMRFGGVREMLVDGAVYEHVGSATLKSASGSEQAEHSENFRRNLQRYIRKWGGSPGHEIYTEAMVVAHLTYSPKIKSAKTSMPMTTVPAKMREIAPGSLIATGKNPGRRRVRGATQVIDPFTVKGMREIAPGSFIARGQRRRRTHR